MKTKIEGERREIFSTISASDSESRMDVSYLLGKPLHCMEGERERGGLSFVFAETSLLSRHFACCLKSSQSEMLSPSQRGRLDAGPHVLVPGSPPDLLWRLKGMGTLPGPASSLS